RALRHRARGLGEGESTLGMTAGSLRSPQALRVRSQQARRAEGFAHVVDLADAAAGETPGLRRAVDGAVDVVERAFAEAPAATLERLQIDRLGEGAHGPLSVEVEEAVEVAEAEGEVGIDGLAGGGGGE